MPETSLPNLSATEHGSHSSGEAVRSMVTFEHEFNDKKTIELLDRQVKVVEVGRPEVPGPDEVPIVIVGGWAEDSDTFRGTIQTLYERGRWVVTLDHPVQSDKAGNYHEVLEEMGIDKADVIAHSGGAGDAMDWASLYPDQVRNIVLANPNGLNGKDSIATLGARFLIKEAMGMTEINNPNARRAKLSGVRKLAGLSNIVHGWTEARAIADADITKAMDAFRAKGHKIGIIQSHSDPIFLTDRIGDNVVTAFGEYDGQKYPETMRVDAYQSAVDKFAGHDDLIMHPEHSAIALDQMLRSFIDSNSQ